MAAKFKQKYTTSFTNIPKTISNLIKILKNCTDIPANGIKELFYQLQNGEIEVMGSNPYIL